MKNFFLGVAMSAVALGAGAQWAQEPTSVMGVQLGGKKEDIPRCPAGNAALKSTTVCVEPNAAGPEYGTLWGLPLNFILGGADVRFVDGRVQLVLVAVRHDESYRRLKAILIERYGPPHSVEDKSVTTLDGAPMESEESTWLGPNVLILLSERAGRFDRSRVAFSYRPLGQKKLQDDARDAKSDASKL